MVGLPGIGLPAMGAVVSSRSWLPIREAPGCLGFSFYCLESVCSWTAPGMAVEPDSGVAVSVTVGALECWWLNRAYILADLTKSVLVDGFLLEFGFASLETLMQLLPPLVSVCGHLLPVVGSLLEHLHVSFTCVLKAQMGASLRRDAGGKLAVEQIFGDPPIRHVGNTAETTLPKQCVRTAKSSAGEHRIVCHLVWPLDVQDAPQAVHMEGVESPFLSGVQSPRLTAIQQGNENAGPVDGCFGMQCQRAVFPYTLWQSGKGCWCSPDLFANLRIHGEVVGQSRTKASELLDHLQLRVTDADSWGRFSTMSHHVSLFEAYCKNKARAGPWGAVTAQQCVLLGWRHREKHVSNENFSDFGLCPKSGQAEQLAIWSGAEIDSLGRWAKGLFQHHCEVYAK